MTAETLELTFDEYVNINELHTDRISISGLGMSNSHSLLQSTSHPNISQVVNEPVVVQLSQYDVDILKLLLVDDARDAVELTASASMVKDMNMNPLGATNLSVPATGTFIRDSTRPNLIGLGVDMNSSQLILNFDEPVDVATLSA